MVKRIIATPLWFFAIWGLWDLVAFVSGAPAILAPLLAVAVSGFVALDPAHLFWPKSERQVS
jgi:hypothetical protein